MDTVPYISTVDDLDKFLEEIDTEVQVTEPVTPKKSNKVCHLHTYFNKIKYLRLHLRSYQINSFVAYEEIKKKIAVMYKPNW